MGTGCGEVDSVQRGRHPPSDYTQNRNIRIAPPPPPPDLYPMQTHPHYALAARAIAYLTEHRATSVSFDDLAGELFVSKYHLQRLFTDWVGVSPKKFHQQRAQYAWGEKRKRSLLALEARHAKPSLTPTLFL